MSWQQIDQTDTHKANSRRNKVGSKCDTLSCKCYGKVNTRTDDRKHNMVTKREVSFQRVSGSLRVTGEADSGATNDSHESQQQGTERHVRDCFSLQRREARLVHRNAENIQAERMRMVRRYRNQTKWKRCSVAAAFHIARTNVRVENR